MTRVAAHNEIIVITNPYIDQKNCSYLLCTLSKRRPYKASKVMEIGKDRIADYGHLKDRVVDWIKSYAEKNGKKSLVIGVSGGIDSAVVSTLCAETGLPTFVLGMPILQNKVQQSLSSNHLDWLVNKYANVVAHKIELTALFHSFSDTLRLHGFGSNNLALLQIQDRD